MAQAERRQQPQQRTIDDTIRDMRNITPRITNPNDQMQRQAVTRLRQEGEGYINRWRDMTPEEREKSGISPEQMDRLRRSLMDLNRRMQELQGGLPPRPQQSPAPRRTFNYDVTIGTGPTERTFRVSLLDPLPIGRESQMLLDMARTHEFFEPSTGNVTTPNSPAPRAHVEQLSGPGTPDFNLGPQAARVDNFEVALNRAREASPPTPVVVAAIAAQQQPQQQSGPRGG